MLGLYVMKPVGFGSVNQPLQYVITNKTQLPMVSPFFILKGDKIFLILL